MYALVHTLLVRLVPAYRRLVRAIEEAVRSVQSVPGALAAVPCSTGEWVRRLADLGRPWTLLDVSQRAVRRAARGLVRPVPITADLSNGLPIPEGSQDVVLCVHALHVLPRQAFQLRRFADRLKPGGALVLVTFDRDETVGVFAGRVRVDHGLATMLSVLPWKVLDRLWTGQACYPDGGELDAALQTAGLDVVSSRPVFAGTSTLRVARRAAEPARAT